MAKAPAARAGNGAGKGGGKGGGNVAGKPAGKARTVKAAPPAKATTAKAATSAKARPGKAARSSAEASVAAPGGAKPSRLRALISFGSPKTPEGGARKGFLRFRDRTAPTGKGLPILDVEGIGPAFREKLAAEDVKSSEDLVAADADALATSTGIPAARIRG